MQAPGRARGARATGAGEGAQPEWIGDTVPPPPSQHDEPVDTPSSWSAVPLDAEAARQLARLRIGYFGAVFLVLSSAFYLRNAIAIGLLEHAWPPLGHPMFLLHTGAIAVHAAVWGLCRRVQLSLGQLYGVDAVGLVGSMALYGALVVVEASTLEHAVAVQSAGAEVLLVAIIVLALVLTHSIIVPLNVRHMFWVSAATAAVGVASACLVTIVGLPAEVLAQKPWLSLNQVLYVGMWSAVAVSVASISARVIHGLQQRVRDANEVGQYTLEERIGEGGMGVVYLARHALLRRPTAIKLLPAHRAGEVAVRRFEQEVRLTSVLTHPNTIAIYDFGRTPDGVFYYAMEYLDGITLEHLVKLDGAQPAARVMQLLKQACGALSEAHAMGLSHRDIKPANMMLCVRGRMPDQLKVLDFGLVKQQASDPAAMGLSVDGALVGTPAYLAPEAIANASRADARSDLYALGAVGYWLLVGEPVFAGQTILEVCLHHLHTTPVPPSERSSMPIPAALDALILQCLAKEPELRPSSAHELGRLLDAIDGAGSWSREQAESWWKERAPTLIGTARAQRSEASTPGPRTIAVDLERRTPGSRVRAVAAR
jgi:eukaryotic-like serine/threonine-protein kinase